MLLILYIVITLQALVECTGPPCNGIMIYQTCYWVTNTQQNAQNGHTLCGDELGGVLGIIPNQSVLDSILTYRQDKGHSSKEYFLGYNDSTNVASVIHLWNGGGVQSWTNWRNGEPNDSLQTCVIMNGFNGFWYDASCSISYHALCSNLPGSSTTTSTRGPTLGTTHVHTVTQKITTTDVSTGITAMCNCQCKISSNLTLDEFQEIIHALTLDKKTLNSFTRKKISADDPRPSAKATGYFGAVLLSLIFGGLFLQDVSTLFFHIKGFYTMQ